MSKNENILEVGAAAPDFTLPSSNGDNWCLSDKRGQIIALLFYPQNETLVCNRQLCSVRDNWANYLATKAEIVGISPGTTDSHRRFAENRRLPLSLLVDDNRLITKRYGLHAWMPIWITRAVVVIDASGIVRYRRVMLRSSRPTDYSVISAIYSAQADHIAGKYKSLSEGYWKRKTPTNS